MTSLEELERRVRTLEEELVGERHVSRYQVEQAARNSDMLHAVRSEVGAVTTRVDHLVGDMAGVKATLVMHGRALDVLQQDVRQLRGELRGGQETTNGRLDRIEQTLGAILAAVVPPRPLA
jgi:hypothetical protein